jgi:hypothetical protein
VRPVDAARDEVFHDPALHEGRVQDREDARAVVRSESRVDLQGERRVLGPAIEDHGTRQTRQHAVCEDADRVAAVKVAVPEPHGPRDPPSPDEVRPETARPVLSKDDPVAERGDPKVRDADARMPRRVERPPIEVAGTPVSEFLAEIEFIR